MANAPTRYAPATRAFVIGFVVVVLGVLGALWWEDYQSHFVYAVTVDGDLLGHVATPQEWTQALADAEAEAAQEMGVPVALKSEVRLTKTRLEAPVGDAEPRDPVPQGKPEEQPLLSGAALREACGPKLNFVSLVWAIAVDAQDVAYVRTEEEARQVLPGLVDDYRQSLLARGNTKVLEATVAEEVICRQAEAPVAKVGNVDQARRVLLRGTDKLKVHVVSRGESLWGIAESNSLTVADLRRANPAVANSDLIRVGQELSLIVPDPYITLTSSEELTYIRYLPHSEQVHEDSSLWPWESFVTEPGVHGKMEVTVRIERVNGDETGRRLVAQRQLSSSETQTFTLGTKVYAERPDGLVWPAPGRVTSTYGWRRREFHRGLDIGALYGSTVLAARAGTVTFAGWRGGFGRLVIIDHGGGFETWYAHLSVLQVSGGQNVDRGQAIGKVGSSGRSTGAHLHFETHLNGDPTDPKTYYPRGG